MRVLIAVQLDPEQIARLYASFPHVEFVETKTKEEMREAAKTCEAIFCGGALSEEIWDLPALKWVQAFPAGINHFPLGKIAERGIVLTNASGAHGPQISENILAMMLAFSTRLPWLVRAQDRHEWIAGAVTREKFVLEGQTLLIAGLGGIGSALAVKARAMKMRVVGLRNRRLDPPPGVDDIITSEKLLESLSLADHVALCLPLTEDTHAFLDEKELRSMKPTAYVYNVGRGQSIERNALLRALQESWIAGAGLDVTDPEPLPADDPLWSFPNVILSQHTSGPRPDLDRHVTDIFLENLRRFSRREPLINVIDPSLGY